MATILTKDIGYFQTTTNFCVDLTLTNTDEANSGNIAQNVEMVITLPSGLSIQPSASSVDQGTFDDGTLTWSVGSILPCHTVTGSFCFTVTDDCASTPFLIDFDTTSDACDCSIDNVDVQYSVDGTSCCDMVNCPKVSHGEYVDDAAAQADGVPVGGHYFNTTTNVMHTRMS